MTESHSFNKFSLQSLSTATHEISSTPSLKSPTCHDYKSGAKYKGELIDNLKSGRGHFQWPNGDEYHGEYLVNERHGFGKQVWKDGSSFEGYFAHDKKYGEGTHVWSNGETYTGTWFNDCRHGLGTYAWSHCSYFGMFFANTRDGYGVLTYSDSGNIFKGLYRKDKRFGPGILIYPKGTQDIGLWSGDKLIRIFSSINADYDFPQIDEIDRHISVPSWYDRESILYDILNPQNMFMNKIQAIKANNFIKNDPYIDTILGDKIKLVDEFLRICRANDECTKDHLIKVPNTTSNFIFMYKHQQKYSYFHAFVNEKFNFDVSQFNNECLLINSSPGKLEQASIEFLEAVKEGNLDKIKSFKDCVHIDICDCTGLTALIIAVLRRNSTIINYLLDNGANVNHILDCGLTALQLCVIKYYSSDKFLPNSALEHKDLPVGRKLSVTSQVFESQSSHKDPNKSRLEKINEQYTILGESTKTSEFDSSHSVLRYKVNVNSDLVNKYTNLLSSSEKILGEVMDDEGNIRSKAARLQVLNEVGKIVELLLVRGADPSLCTIPYPALCFAVAAGDVKIVKFLLEKGANCSDKMPQKYASLSPLILACGSVGDSSAELVKLLLENQADPNDAADSGREYLSMVDEDWEQEAVSDEIQAYICGRTPLHIACARNDAQSARIVKLLIDHSANPNVICNGQSPLSLAIASGNREAIDILLKSGTCDPNLPLPNGVGTALCVVCSTLYESNWPLAERIRLVDKLINYGANVLQPVVVGLKRQVGTVVDYAHFMHNSDNRIAHTPYHSLTHVERETYNARKDLLNHLGKRFREQTVEQEKRNAYYSKYNSTGWGTATVRRRLRQASISEMSDIESNRNENGLKKKWCYSCGRSLGVKLMTCTRCKQVYFCSNNCKQKSWNEFHKNECNQMKLASLNIQPSAQLVVGQQQAVLPPLITKRDNFMLNFINQEHITFLSNDQTTNLPQEFKTQAKQISFILDAERLKSSGNGRESSGNTHAGDVAKSEKSEFSRLFADKMKNLEKQLGKSRFKTEEISINPLFRQKDNYSFI